MESVALATPKGIDARLGWDPSMSEHDRKRVLAKELVAARLGIEPTEVRVDREAPTVFGQHTHLIAHVGEEVAPLAIRSASYRAGTAVAVADLAMPLGIDIRDLTPDAATKAEMRAHSHLWEGTNDLELQHHWAYVQAVIAADGRGVRVRPETVKLDGSTGWIPDRPVRYRLLDLSRNAFTITLAYAPLPTA